MHAGHLCEDALAHNGLVGGHGNAAVTLDEAADVEEFALVDVRDDVEVVVQNGLHAGQRCVAGALAQAVDGGVDALAAAEHGR